MKQKIYFELIYWCCALTVLSLIVKSMSYSFAASFFISAALLPGAFIAKFLYKQIDFSNKRLGVTHCIYLGLTVLLIEYLAITLTHLYAPVVISNECPDILINPIFLWFVLIALIVINELLNKKMFSSMPYEKYIEFTSDRKKIKLEIDTIKVIESNDIEVWVRTITDMSYRTKMKISHWENILDDRFIRVHRSFIVNRNHISKYDTTEIKIGEMIIPISRKYKDKLLYFYMLLLLFIS